ncbi:MAG: metal-dependent hydrolase [Pseudomonadota bacterium]
MASFQTHLAGALAVSGLSASALLVVGVANNRDMLLYFALGTIGGLLPDLDAERSTPLQAGFSLLSLVAAFSLLLAYAARLSVVELLLLWLGTYFFFRLLVFRFFVSLVVHRGILHSLPAALLACFLTAVLVYHFLGFTPVRAWLCGGFMGMGYLVHLLMDEAVSVNLLGTHIKRSLGTAIKLYARQSPLASLLVYAALFIAASWSPPFGPVKQQLWDSQVPAHFRERLWPHGEWFRLREGISLEAVRGDHKPVYRP